MSLYGAVIKRCVLHTILWHVVSLWWHLWITNGSQRRWPLLSNAGWIGRPCDLLFPLTWTLSPSTSSQLGWGHRTDLLSSPSLGTSMTAAVASLVYFAPLTSYLAEGWPVAQWIPESDPVYKSYHLELPHSSETRTGTHRHDRPLDDTSPSSQSR